MKKSLLAVSAVLALGLTACSKEDAAPEAEATAEVTEVTEEAAAASSVEEAVDAADAAEPALGENEKPQ